MSIGSLLAVDLSGTEAWAGSAATVMTLAAALTALPLASLAERKGRRIGLVTGLLAALAGALLIILAVISGWLLLLLLGTAGVGVGSASNLQARFAAVDLADADHRGRSLSVVVWAITIGAVAGPNLIQPGAVVGQALGLPPIAGPFVISSAGLVLSCLLLVTALRPDPLLLARALAATPGEPVTEDAQETMPGGVGNAAPTGNTLMRGLRAVRGSRPAILALTAIVAAHAVMVGVMSMTPVHLQALVTGASATHSSHVAGTDALVIIGFTISLHIAGMFALSPLMGWLTDKIGRAGTMSLGCALLVLAVGVAGVGQGQAAAVATGLVLLGLGWSATTISGSTLLAESVAMPDRVVVQGVSDTAMGAAGAIGGAISGPVLAAAGYAGLNVAAGVVAAGVLAAAVFFTARSRTGVRA